MDSMLEHHVSMYPVLYFGSIFECDSPILEYALLSI